MPAFGLHDDRIGPGYGVEPFQKGPHLRRQATGRLRIRGVHRDVNLTAGGLVNVGGSGGKAVARVGDTTSGGHVITGGSATVFAVD